MKEVDFGKAPHGELFTIAVALAAGAVALFLRADPSMGSGLHTGMIVMFVTSAILVLAGITIYRYHMKVVQRELAESRKLERERDKLREVPRLTGHWIYEVRSTDLSDQKQIHSGMCEFKPDETSGPRSFKIYGTRLKMWKSGDATAVECNLDWHSTWCEFTDKGELRFVYEINLDSKQHEGYATLDVQDRAKMLRGNYALHGPSGEALARGTIIFNKCRAK